MDGIQSLARGLRILDLIVNSGRSMSITELAAELEIDKSSASRLVKTLVSFDYLQQETGSRRFVPGKRWYHVGWQMMNMLPLRSTARPFLNRLVMETGECSHTAVYAEGKALVIDDVETENTLRVAGRTGRMIPLHCTAVGKGLLAFADLPFPAELPAYTGYTITDEEALQAHMTQVRAQGYALDDEEYDEGIRCIAAPVYNHTGLVVASIGASGPAVRVTRDRVPALAAYVMNAAADLSAALGYQQVESQPQSLSLTNGSRNHDG
ncbi:MAG TPA: IclR family transcriptional regulator [Phototrophicaceae bacterium]|jgi:DNA-binding IclR family transcriptional regulator|nr:IclR family transcriptional regulator [Phototrophicaceae bacterium]